MHCWNVKIGTHCFRLWTNAISISLWLSMHCITCVVYFNQHLECIFCMKNVKMRQKYVFGSCALTLVQGFIPWKTCVHRYTHVYRCKKVQNSVEHRQDGDGRRRPVENVSGRRFRADVFITPLFCLIFPFYGFQLFTHKTWNFLTSIWIVCYPNSAWNIQPK